MAKVAVFIHGMWATPDVWRNWRTVLEERGWQTTAPALRHHDAPPSSPPAALGTTSLLDYAADLADGLTALPAKPVVIGHSMGGLLALMLCARGLARAGVLLTPAPPAEVLALRPSNLWAFARIQMKWGVVRRASQRFSHFAGYVEYPDQGHWVLGQPGWERIADDTAVWLDGKAA